MATKQISQQAKEVLQNSIVIGNNIKLPPGQLERPVYVEVNKALTLIGGKWKGGNTQAFIFPSDPTDLLQEISGGDLRNLKKEFQFFATPTALADKMVQMAQISKDDIVLEPSAGQGAIIDSILKLVPDLGDENLFCVEHMPTNQLILKKKYGTNSKVHIMYPLNSDFLRLDERDQCFTRIVANPPFTNNQDIDHIYKMYEVLKPGGIIVTLSSVHLLLSTNKKEQEFRRWLSLLDHKIESVPAGTFKESGTNVACSLITIRK